MRETNISETVYYFKKYMMDYLQFIDKYTNIYEHNVSGNMIGKPFTKYNFI